MRRRALASLAGSASLPCRGREWCFIFKISIYSNKLQERLGAVQVLGGNGTEVESRALAGAGGHPDPPGTTPPGELAGEPSELRPGAASPGWGVEDQGQPTASTTGPWAVQLF